MALIQAPLPHRLRPHCTAQTKTLVQALPPHLLGLQVGPVPEQGDQVFGQLPVRCLVGLVQQQVDEVEAGHEGGGELDVLHHAKLGVVPGADGVGAGQHCTGDGEWMGEWRWEED